MDAKPRLLDRVRDRIRVKHYSYRTEQQYVAWIKRAVRSADVLKPASCHTLRHCFATHLLFTSMYRLRRT